MYLIVMLQSANVAGFHTWDRIRNTLRNEEATKSSAYHLLLAPQFATINDRIFALFLSALLSLSFLLHDLSPDGVANGSRSVGRSAPFGHKMPPDSRASARRVFRHLYYMRDGRPRSVASNPLRGIG